MGKVTPVDVAALMEDRPRKLLPEQVGYAPAPQGSEMRCGSCFHMYRRMIDNFGVCELVRPENDEEIKPHYRCELYSIDGDVMPFMESEESPTLQT